MEDHENIGYFRDCIKSLPVFKVLTSEQLEIIFESCREEKHAKGVKLFKQGTTLTHFLIIAGGKVKIYIEGINNHNQIIKIAGPYSMLGGPGFYTDFKYHFTCATLEDTKVWFINVSAFTKIINLNRDFAFSILKWVELQTMTNYSKLIELTQKGMHGRIASALLYLNNEVFNDKDGIIRIARQDLADLSAMALESATRMLKEFKDANIISISDKKIIITDMIRLKDMSIKG